MKKFILILFLALISFSCKSQYPNFFWSYPQQNYTTIHYGALYNRFVVVDSRKITSSDSWHVMTNNELIYISTYADNLTNSSVYGTISALSGGKLKETGDAYWSFNTSASNDYSFNGRGNGRREHNTGYFTGLKSYSYLWTSDVYSGYYIYCRYSKDDASLIRSTWYATSGMAIRLVRNCTTEELALPDDAVSATYTGNNLKVYRCCKIGNYIITADNLAETKFRNGDWITGFDGGTYTPISNSTWSGLTTGAMCFYNDVINNG